MFSHLPNSFTISCLALLTGCMCLGNTAFGQYFLNGSAEQLSCNCYRLTEDGVQSASGSVWNTHQINLTEAFDFTFDVYLGDPIGEGADGIAFVLQPVDTVVGSLGNGLGYSGISPSVAIEIDTYRNSYDETYDHVGIHVNGDPDDTSPNTIEGPEYALVSGGNIEDDQWHVFRVSWDPGSLTLRMYMDGSLRLEHTEDLVANYLLNDPMVYWGFTGSTGFYTNRQEFCLTITPGLASAENEVCEGQELVFTDDSYSALGEVVSWHWDFGNGITSEEQNPGPVVFAEAGTYWVSQTIVDAAGCDASDSLLVTVNPNPEVDFTASEACAGQEVDLVDASSVDPGSIVDREWDLGNNTTDFGSSVSVLYAEAGTYDVSLQVTTSGGCTDSITSEVTVFENPVADGTVESNGLDAMLTTELENGEEAYWLILDTVHNTLGELNYAFPDSGWYNVSLVVTNANGCMDSTTYSIYIEGLPEYDLPNVFTPNGDDMNERFQPETYAVVEANMRIFNRWGRPVFTYEGAIPQTENWGWDGTVNGGVKAAAGTYYYTLDLKGVNGYNFSEHGTVTLIR